MAERSDFQWLSIIPRWVALMSGALSLVREIAATFYPGTVSGSQLFRLCSWSAFVISAGWAWWIEHKKFLSEQDKNAGARIEGEIQRASVDTQIYENNEWHQIPAGVCVTVLVKAVNHAQIDAWFGDWPIIDISFGNKTQRGTSSPLPPHQFVLEYNDPSLADKKMLGLFQSVWIGGSDWLPGRPRQGYLCFVVPGVDRSALEPETIRASICITLYDSLGKAHPIKAREFAISKGLVREVQKV